MKPSGTSYLRDIPITWNAKRIKYCVEICNGAEYADIVVDEGGFPVMGSGGEFARASKYCYSKESVLLGRKGTIDKPLFIKEPFWCVDTMFYTKMKEETYAKYLYYCSLNIRFDYYVTLTALPSMTQRDLGSEKIALPSFPEQTVIADFLDTQCEKIDSIIADLEKQIDLLQKYKKSLITETVTKGLDKSVPMKDSGIEWIGEIPEHWEVKKIKHCCDNIGSGTTPESSNYDFYDGEINWIQSGDLYNTSIITSTEKTVTDFAMKTYSALKKYCADFVIVAMYGASVGNVAISKITACANQACCILLSDATNDLKYLYYWLVHCKDDLIQQSAGGGQPNISQQKIKNEPMLSLPINEQAAIANYLDTQCTKIDAIIESKKEQLSKINDYKKSLIYEYVTGKKRVKGATENGN